MPENTEEYLRQVGLAAKPVIDIVLAVADARDESSYAPALAGQGFQLHIREPDWFEHSLLKSRDIASNLHVFSHGCEEVDRNARGAGPGA